MGRSAVEIVRAYGVDAWNKGRDDWIADLCADPIIRHDANREVRLSHVEQRARMRHNYETLRPVFEPVVLAGDHEHVTLVWNVTGRDPSWKLCGIEIFRVVDGKITEVWNSTYMDGRWGLSKTLGGSLDGGAMAPLPLVRADVTAEAGRVDGHVIAPVDAGGMAIWLTHMFGQPEVEPAGDLRRLQFKPGGPPAPLSLTVTDSCAPSMGLENVQALSLSIELERSGLVNATVALTAAEAAPGTQGPFIAPSSVRLAYATGAFVSGGMSAPVIDGAIVISPSGEASGRVTLHLSDPAPANGLGKLTLAWQQGREMLMFEGTAKLSQISDAPPKSNALHVTYTWEGKDFCPTITTVR